MDPKDWLKKPMGIPVDPAKQKDPEADGDRAPAEGRREFLNDITEQHGGQRTEVGVPYDGSGEVQRGRKDRYSGGDELRKELEDDSLPAGRRDYQTKKE
jgi:hypothetical protein